MKLNNNDDSHNSGLNLLIYNMLLDIESHPAWVCGLKLTFILSILGFNKSHPAWVCGLKLIPNGRSIWLTLSHPAWVCGLKQFVRQNTSSAGKVTPCVGVWIETPTIS